MTKPPRLEHIINTLRGMLAICCLGGFFVPAHLCSAQTVPPNDNFSKAISLPGTNLRIVGSNQGGTKEPGEGTTAGDLGGASVWWNWKAPVSGILTVSTKGSSSPTGDFDTVLEIFTGTGFGDLVSIAANDDNFSDPLHPDDVASQVTFPVSAGVTYHIKVDGNSYGGQAPAQTGRIALSIQETAGTKVPSWSLPSIDGNMISSADFAGRVLVLNFWATWCPPCVDEVPELIRLQGNYAGSGLTVIGISVDTSDDGSLPSSLVGGFADAYHINYPVVMADLFGGGMYDEYMQLAGNPGAIPTTMIIDRDSNLAGVLVGSRTYDVFESVVKPLLFVIQPELPRIQTALFNSELTLTWPGFDTGLILQSAEISPANAWVDIAETPKLEGANSVVRLPLGAASRFFRLIRH